MGKKRRGKGKEGMKMKKKRISGIIILSVLSISLGILLFKAPALSGEEKLQLAPLNPEFVKYLEDIKEGKVMCTYTEEGHALGLLPIPVDLSHNKILSSTLKKERVSLPASYDLRDLGRLTSIKNQATCGSCWAFATYGSLESGLLTDSSPETWDFSENNLKDCHGLDNTGCEGGNYFLSMAYLGRWAGPIRESDDPYQDSEASCTTGLTVQKHIGEVIITPDQDSAKIKQAVTDYGAMYTTFYWNSAYYNESDYTYYYNGTTSGNHAVCIVGWDDSKVITGGTPTPPGNGAWIIKNSWGTSWGDSGYGYISYYDTQMAKNNASFINAEATDVNTSIYDYDPLGWVGNIGYGTTTAYAANIFTPTATETLEAVGFYANTINTSYEIKVYDTFSGGTFSNQLGTTQSGTCADVGYYTIDLDTSISITNGDDFAITIKFTTPGYNLPIPVEYVYAGYSSSATASPGQSYTSSNGATWTDITTVLGFSTYNVCIKGIALAPDTFTVTFDTVPADTGGITFDGTEYDDGDTVSKDANTYSITAGPKPGYTFDKWHVSGGLTVADADSAATTCAVTDDGTLRMVQTATTFTDSDFDDTWNLFVVWQDDNTADNGWIYGPVESNGDGTIAAGPGNELTKEDGTTAAVLGTSTYTVNANGTIEVTLNISTGPATLNIKGAMNNRKDVISLVSTMPDSSPDVYGAGTLIYKDSDTDAFAQTDFSGTWNLYASWQDEDAVDNGWVMGSVISDGAGNITGGTLTDEGGVQDTVTSGSYTLQADGTFTAFSLVMDGKTLTVHGAAMNESKDVVGMVFTGTPDTYYGGGAIVKNQATDFGDSDLKGTWRFYAVGQEENLVNNGWGYGTLIIDGLGQVTSGTMNREDGTSESIGPESYELDTNGFLTTPLGAVAGTNPGRFGAMNDGCDVIAFVRTYSESTDEYGAGVMVYPSSAAAGAAKDDGGGGVCAIATASYGTPMAEEVKALSAFRDQYLLTNKPGRTLVSAYERISPPVADFIRDKEALKAIIRAGLKPLLKVADHLTSK